ncbi:hypothetical protein PGT21_004393 [Puccinia graminis f. sp. tritici]|uniref:Chitinase n=1 Tax=Puccinia graminis f. sp. tritici TaxID=56615 RepID=A0A5B0P7G4_PUCGR|nr:hypothetical protein PGT21_004393 [Puccinia graminis f. sp. tritici]KAA1134280.1 hypothetical protein PGTUg99_034504 [Puccinia graminis f. sp. tritici]
MERDAGQNNTSGLLRKASSTIGSGDLDGHSGNQIQFTDIFKWGIVQLDLCDNEGRLTGIDGYQVTWDRCSSTISVTLIDDAFFFSPTYHPSRGSKIFTFFSLFVLLCVCVGLAAFSKPQNIVITYDDTISIGIKASYALAAGIGGVGFWDMNGDHHSMLIDSSCKNLAKFD